MVAMPISCSSTRVFSARTTLIFAGSGVGKTSFLKAKLIPELRPTHFVAYHNRWAGADTPLAAVMKTVATELQLDLAQPPLSVLTALRRKLTARPRPEVADWERVEDASSSSRRSSELILILDQFEEMFRYSGYTGPFWRFIRLLCRAIRNLRIRVIFAIREEFLGELSVFDSRVPDLFLNYHRLKQPGRTDAAEIIRKTVSDAHGSLDPALLDRLLDDLSQIQRHHATVIADPEPTTAPRPIAMTEWDSQQLRSDRVPETNLMELDTGVVPPPYLQIVCHQLWKRAKTPGDRFPGVYTEGEAAGIRNSFCLDRLRRLNIVQKHLASRALDFLVTTHGAKMAYDVRQLARYIRVPRGLLGSVLDTLSEERHRILRRTEATAEKTVWYELYHDVFGTDLSAWNEGFRRIRRIVLLLMAILMVVAAAGFQAYVRQPRENLAILEQVPVPEIPVARLAYERLRGNLLYAARAQTLWAAYWERRAKQAASQEQLDEALLQWLISADESADGAPRRRAAVPLLDRGVVARLVSVIRPVSRSGAPLALKAAGFVDDEIIWATTGEGSLRATTLWNAKSGAPVPLSWDRSRATEGGGMGRGLLLPSPDDPAVAGLDGVVLRGIVSVARRNVGGLVVALLDEETGQILIYTSTNALKVSLRACQPITPGSQTPGSGVRPVALMLSPTGRWLAIEAGGNSQLLDLAEILDACGSANAAQPASPPRAIFLKASRPVIFSADGNRLLTVTGATSPGTLPARPAIVATGSRRRSGRREQAQVWNTSGERLCETSVPDGIQGGSLSPDGSKLLVVARKLWYLWRIDAGRCIPVTIPSHPLASSMPLLLDATTAAVVTEGRLQRWNLDSGMPIDTGFRTTGPEIPRSPSGGLLLESSGTKLTVLRASAPASLPPRMPFAPTAVTTGGKYAWALMPAAADRTAAGPGANRRRQLRIWDVSRRTELKTPVTVSENAVVELVASATYALVTEEGGEGVVRIVDVNSAVVVAEYPTADFQVSAVDPSGGLLAIENQTSSPSQSSVDLWGLEAAPKRIGVLKPSSSLGSMTFSPDGGRLEMWIEEGVEIWGTKPVVARGPLITVDGAEAVFWGNKGAVAVLDDAHGIRVNRRESGTWTQFSLSGTSGAGIPTRRYGRRGVAAVVFSPDDRRLAAVSAFTGTLELFDVASARSLAKSDLPLVAPPRRIVWESETRLIVVTDEWAHSYDYDSVDGKLRYTAGRPLPDALTPESEDGLGTQYVRLTRTGEPELAAFEFTGSTADADELVGRQSTYEHWSRLLGLALADDGRLVPQYRLGSSSPSDNQPQ
jgi:WD40 repeat protein